MNSDSKLRMACLVLMIVLGACSTYDDIHKPVVTDDELELIFRENKPDFEQILRMSEVDASVPRIAYDFTWVSGVGSSTDSGNPGISKERWETYRALFQKLDLTGGINREDDGTVAFLAFGRGLSVSGLTKGYLYTIKDRNCTAASLDDLQQYQNQGFVCKRIDENWYLYVAK